MPVYIDPDRNSRLKVEAMLRRVGRSVKNVAADGQAFPNSAQRTVTKSWRPHAKVEPGVLGEEAKILRNPAALVS